MDYNPMPLADYGSHVGVAAILTLRGPAGVGSIAEGQDHATLGRTLLQVVEEELVPGALSESLYRILHDGFLLN